MAHKANGSASRNYTPSLRVYHPRGGVKNPNAMSRRDKECNVDKNYDANGKRLWKCGKHAAEPLDATKPLAQPLLVVSRPLSLAMVAHQYVASVMVECDGDKTKARKTLGISIGGLNRYLARIESGEIGKQQTHVRNSTRRDAGNGKARKTVQPMPAEEHDEGLSGVRNAG